MSTATVAPASRFPADPVAAVAALEPLVAAHRDEMDRDRRLAPAVVAAMADIGILRAAVPRELGGPAYDPRTQVELVEAFSRLDGSIGWCAMIASASSFVVGFLSEERARHWFGPHDASLAGQLSPTGRADRTDGGYRVSGRFRFGSGSGHATMFLAGCLEHDRGELVRGRGGRPQLRTVLVRPDQCTVIDTWHTTGLAGTGSNDYVLDDVFVPVEDSYDPSAPPLRSEPLYRYPPLFLLPHTGVPLGIARAAIDVVLELAGSKELYPGAKAVGSDRTMADDPGVQHNVALAEARFAAMRAFAYDTIEQLWEPIAAGERIPTRLRAMYRVMMTFLHQEGKAVVELMYDTASASAIYRTNPLDRLMRDMLTGAQHRMVHPKLYRPAGRLLLGLDSGDPMV